MHHDYRDITDLVAKLNEIRGPLLAAIRPLWWDEHGCPRYQPHHPKLCPDIYAHEVVLLLISCQSCGREIPVQMSMSNSDQIRAMVTTEWSIYRHGKTPETTRVMPTLADSVRRGTIHYGDPPAHDGDNGEYCHAGCTMNVWDLKVLEFWSRTSGDWGRVAELEIELPDLTDSARTEDL